MPNADWRAGTAPPPGPGLLLRGALGYLHLPLALPRMNIDRAKIPLIQSSCLVLAFLAVVFTYLGLAYLPSASDSEHIYGNK